jgi:3-oxoacyl-ACP reductase-like protein
MFKGYTAYPSLADEMARVKAETEAPAETQAPAPPAGKVEDVTMDVLEVVNELAAKDPTELSDDDKKLIEDCNKNQFLGKASYPGVKFQ